MDVASENCRKRKMDSHLQHKIDESEKIIPADDRGNIALLLILYTLQGIPMGLSASLPMIMKERGVTYQSLSLFSLVSLPFSLKLFWAPVVDSWYFHSIGRRKTWLIPTQIITGLIMIFGSYYVNIWMNESHSTSSEGGKMDVFSLTVYFGGLYFLMATQDIAVDGWALTILSREHVTYASICNSIGQSLGVFVANQSYIALTDPIWCRRFLGKSEAVFTLAGFMCFWGWIFILTTVVIAIYKSVKSSGSSEEPDGLRETFRQTVSVLKIRSVQVLCMLLLTFKLAFAATDSVFLFRLQEIGVEKSDIATMSSLLIVVGFLVPWWLSSRLSAQPLQIMVIAYILKLGTSFLRWLIIEVIRRSDVAPASFGWWQFAPIFCVLVLHEVVGTALFISVMSFFARISDPSIGGTYMTLLNTVTNLGSMWPRPLALWLLPLLSHSRCVDKNGALIQFEGSDAPNICKICTLRGGQCKTFYCICLRLSCH